MFNCERLGSHPLRAPICSSRASSQLCRRRLREKQGPRYRLLSISRNDSDASLAAVERPLNGKQRAPTASKKLGTSSWKGGRSPAKDQLSPPHGNQIRAFFCVAMPFLLSVIVLILGLLLFSFFSAPVFSPFCSQTSPRQRRHSLYFESF